MNVKLLRQFGQRLLAPYGSQGHLRFESRRVVPAWSSAHRLSCSAAILAAVRQRLHLSNLFKNPEPALPIPARPVASPHQHPSQTGAVTATAGSPYAAAGVGSRYPSLRASNAQAIRAILLASATAASRAGFVASRPRIQVVFAA